MEKANDALVLFTGNFVFGMTDFSLTIENKALFGWLFNGFVGLMIAANLCVMLVLGFLGIVKSLKRSLIIRHNKKIMALKGKADH